MFPGFILSNSVERWFLTESQIGGLKFFLCRIWWQNRSFSFPLIHFPLLIYRLFAYIFHHRTEDLNSSFFAARLFIVVIIFCWIFSDNCGNISVSLLLLMGYHKNDVLLKKYPTTRSLNLWQLTSAFSHIIRKSTLNV